MTATVRSDRAASHRIISSQRARSPPAVGAAHSAADASCASVGHSKCMYVTRYLLGSQSATHHFCKVLKNVGKTNVFNVTAGHIETLIKRGVFGRPGNYLPAKQWPARRPRRAAPGARCGTSTASSGVRRKRVCACSAPWRHSGNV